MYLNGRGFKVTLFMRQEDRHILPSPSQGHVLLLRDVKTSDWLGSINGTVYPDKLKWVAYNPETGKTYFPDTALHPQFNTFHEPSRNESMYFVQLGEWWRATKEEEERGAVSIEPFERNRREHRLIKDCVCNQFFDATVEVIIENSSSTLTHDVTRSLDDTKTMNRQYSYYQIIPHIPCEVLREHMANGLSPLTPA